MGHHIPSTKSLFSVGTVVFHGTESQADARMLVEFARDDAQKRAVSEHGRRLAQYRATLDRHNAVFHEDLPERVRDVTPLPGAFHPIKFPELYTYSQTVPARKRRAAAKVRPGNGVVKHDVATARGVAACRAVAAEFWATAPRRGYWGTYQGEYVLVTVHGDDVIMSATAGGVLASAHLDGPLDTSVPFGADQLSLV